MNDFDNTQQNNEEEQDTNQHDNQQPVNPEQASDDENPNPVPGDGVGAPGTPGGPNFFNQNMTPEEQAEMQKIFQAQMIQRAIRSQINQLWVWAVLPIIFQLMDLTLIFNVINSMTLLDGNVRIYVLCYVFSIAVLLSNLVCVAIFSRQLKKQYYNLTLLFGMIFMLLLNVAVVTVSVFSQPGATIDFFTIVPILYSLIQVWVTYRAYRFFQAITRNIPSS
ncbi:hypothetical protein [Culicoidibacter larvae]|uniref:Uncharacterized protein n=1 Tax=Culicoidibacter larvae TaxID=2579976 RepID=A0A5R8Q6R0_9FIRM|nr:hypothetical protein [Culicoidibacter larvae]TLG71102.1 hypothetical protein FEZ08_11620 [Culicoidibacter larvae]